MSEEEINSYILALDTLLWPQKMDVMHWLLAADYKRIILPSVSAWVTRNASAVSAYSWDERSANKFIANEKARE